MFSPSTFSDNACPDTPSTIRRLNANENWFLSSWKAWATEANAKPTVIVAPKSVIPLVFRFSECERFIPAYLEGCRKSPKFGSGELQLSSFQVLVSALERYAKIGIKPGSKFVRHHPASAAYTEKVKKLKRGPLCNQPLSAPQEPKKMEKDFVVKEFQVHGIKNATVHNFGEYCSFKFSGQNNSRLVYDVEKWILMLIPHGK